ncbi:MAG: iron-containing alcohol dehydrogenase [Acidobacteriota bacterium]|jgi:alcohol dehydrogenase class IV
MKAEPSDAPVRVLRGPGALERCGEEAAALGSRALVVSSGRPDSRQEGLVERVRRLLQTARVGQRAFARVPRRGEPVDAARGMAPEAAREAHCSLVIGVGDDRVLDVARFAGGEAWLPTLLVPTVLGYGRPIPTDTFPLPDVLVLDAAAQVGAEPGATAAEAIVLLAGLLEAYAASDPGPSDREVEEILRTLVEQAPRAVRQPGDPEPRGRLIEVAAGSSVVLASKGNTPRPVEDLAARLAGRQAGPDTLRGALLPAVLEVSAAGDRPLAAERVARFGREVLDINEEDHGRAAQWAAGGVRQWVRSLGMETRVSIPAPRGASGDGVLLEVLAVMRR